MAIDEVRRAIKTFFAGSRRVVEGELVKVDDEIMKGREHLFEALHVGRNKAKAAATAAVKAAEASVTAPATSPAPAAPETAPEAGGS